MPLGIKTFDISEGISDESSLFTLHQERIKGCLHQIACGLSTLQPSDLIRILCPTKTDSNDHATTDTPQICIF